MVSKRDYACAEKALDILAKINPSAECQSEANLLIDEINTQLRKIEAAEAAAAKARWEFKVKQYEDKMAETSGQSCCIGHLCKSFWTY